MASCVASGTARSSGMKAIKIKDMHCWCPAGLETKADNKRDTGVLSQGSWSLQLWWSSLGCSQWCWVIWGRDFPAVPLDLSSSLRTHCTQCLALIFIHNLELPVDAGLAFAWQSFVCRADKEVWGYEAHLVFGCAVWGEGGRVGLTVLTDRSSTGKTGLIQAC